MTRTSRRFACLLLFTALPFLALPSRASDDTSRFYGTWKTTVPMNGKVVTIVSVHDASGYKNFVETPNGLVPAGEGTFQAANGIWSSNTPAPNNGGVYHFLNNNTVIATNSAGQTVTWIRDKSAERAAAKAPTPVDANTAANNEVGYVPPSERPGTSVNGPVSQPPQPVNSTSHNVALSPEDAALSLNVKAGFAALKSGDRAAAWRDFMADAQRGNSDAQAAIGSMLFHQMNPPGTGFYKDAEKWLLASANQGNMHGMDMLAQFYYSNARNMTGGINPGVNHTTLSPEGQRLADAKFTQARQWLEKSAAQGDIYAMGNLAILLNAGVGGPRDPNRAAQLIAQVKRGPDVDFARRVATDPAGKALAASWQSGHYAEAVRTAEDLAAKGDPSAESLLGRAYYEGIGVPRNYSTALFWLNKAVQQNNADAMFFLGLMYEHGWGVTQDVDRALKLFDQAADLGQGYAKMEAQGMRMQGEINRIAARTQPSNVLENACNVAGGTPVGFECLRGGQSIDPFNPYAGETTIAPEPVFESGSEPEE